MLTHGFKTYDGLIDKVYNVDTWTHNPKLICDTWTHTDLYSHLDVNLTWTEPY